MPQTIHSLRRPHERMAYDVAPRPGGKRSTHMPRTPRRLVVLCALGLAAPALAQAPDFSRIQSRVTKVAGNVYMIDGTGGFAGGNIGVSVGEDGVLIVDDQFAPLAPKIQAVLKEVTDK